MTATSIPAPSIAFDTKAVIAFRRRTVDKFLVAVGGVATVAFVVAGALLMWGSGFADEYVGDELRSQSVVFPPAEALEAEGRTDLLKYAGEPVDSGVEAEAYASYIDGHLAGIADGLTYAELGAVERQAQAAVTAAVSEGAPASEVEVLQAESDRVTAQRDTLFKGETLRGLLLTAYAWSTVGAIAGYAAVAAFAAAAVMAVLVVLGAVHARRTE